MFLYYLEPGCDISTLLLLSLLRAPVKHLTSSSTLVWPGWENAPCFGFYGTQVRLHVIF